LIGRLILAIACLLAFPAAVRSQGGTATNFTIRDLTGKHLRLSDFKKNVVLMYFWATWCKHCTGELRHLEKLYRRHKARGFVVLAISMDGPESQAGVKPVVQRYDLTFPVAIDRETKVVKLYNPKHAAPFSVMLRRGTVVRMRESFQGSDLPAVEKEILDFLR
jgi:peroxiredoxin